MNKQTTHRVCQGSMLYNRPAQHMARGPHAARENSVAENVAKARLRIITCPFRISSTLPRNRLLQPTASLCWSIWPFELSELCRPALQCILQTTSEWTFEV